MRSPSPWVLWNYYYKWKWWLLLPKGRFFKALNPIQGYANKSNGLCCKLSEVSLSEMICKSNCWRLLSLLLAMGFSSKLGFNNFSIPNWILWNRALFGCQNSVFEWDLEARKADKNIVSKNPFKFDSLRSLFQRVTFKFAKSQFEKPRFVRMKAWFHFNLNEILV